MTTQASIEVKPVLLQELAASCGHGLRDIWIDHFQHILAHLVFHHTKKEQGVLKFIAATTDIHIQYIRWCSVQSSSLGLAEKGTRLMKGSQGREEGLQEIADYLSPRLLGILGFLDSKLVSSSTMYNLTQNSLKTALKLKDEEFYDIGCHAWTNFLYNLDESTLVGLIEEVVAVMKPLVKKRPEEMAPVLTSVLVETPSVKEFLANMPLLPEDDSLSIINKAILEHQLKVVG
ncbi:hypothetical protein Pmani_036631 [Petrolisthes manimaculis]|uniref:Uncharacterized protein n=1 Tax=Petrolisthes manimaculis TaxID=1843537 RepID=A0AAE1NJ81_9EUCA|nr:hypothetical protein Pmani_036631 [Petrolisthes manimaculis]